jgi:ankyrin repeat protein
VNKNAETALHVAANMDDGDMVDLLIERGANRDAMDHEGVTPLQVAGGLGCDMALERLIGAGADPFAQDNRGRSFVVDFLFCTAHREWNQTLATAQRIEHMIEIEPEFGARAWETMQENKEILAMN